MSFALDRLSNAELLARGIATISRPTPLPEPTPAEEVGATWLPIAAEIPGIIYVVQAPPTPAVKIGFTRGAELIYRIKSLQTGNPYPIKVLAQAVGLSAQEREAHALFASERLTGEWFNLTPQVVAFIEALAFGINAALPSRPGGTP